MKLAATEVVLAAIILVLLVFFVNPFMGWMPDMLHYMAAGGLIVLVALFGGLVWRERASDEREELHRFIGARVAYLAGVIVLALGIVTESISRVPDTWLIAALAVMILGKLVGRYYARVER